MTMQNPRIYDYYFVKRIYTEGRKYRKLVIVHGMENEEHIDKIPFKLGIYLYAYDYYIGGSSKFDIHLGSKGLKVIDKGDGFLRVVII